MSPSTGRRVLSGWVAFTMLVASGCKDTPARRLQASFEEKYADAPWFSSIQDYDFSNEGRWLGIHTSLPVEDPRSTQWALEMCKAVTDLSPVKNDTTFVTVPYIRDQGLGADGSQLEPIHDEISIVAVAFSLGDEESCEVTLEEDQVEEHLAGLEAQRRWDEQN